MVKLLNWLRIEWKKYGLKETITLAFGTARWEESKFWRSLRISSRYGSWMMDTRFGLPWKEVFYSERFHQVRHKKRVDILSALLKLFRLKLSAVQVDYKINRFHSRYVIWFAFGWWEFGIHNFFFTYSLLFNWTNRMIIGQLMPHELKISWIIDWPCPVKTRSTNIINLSRFNMYTYIRRWMIHVR